MNVFSTGCYPQSPDAAANSSHPTKRQIHRPDQYASVDRQDSLMLCQELQAKDGIDFMDESMDLTPYLKDLQDVDANDLGEEFLEKQKLIENDIIYQGPFSNAHYTDLDLRESDMFNEDKLVGLPSSQSTAYDITSDVQVSGRNIGLKSEIPWEDNEKMSKKECSNDISNETTTTISSSSSCSNKCDIGTQSTPSQPRPSTSRLIRTPKQQVELQFTPTIKPRKYSLKPESEKKSALYRLKREKNNDAVRKSREKARKQQMMKDNQIKELQQEVANMNNSLKNKDKRIETLEGKLKEEHSHVIQLTAENKRLRNELFKKRFPKY
ncbi:unnamed protein product [Anisakis simplex]|uniref:BZIP domain-containing protein n=2 Tax=Anisakis simplex TaxID=6269 RepID=A0A0M3K8G2_ANISI|nr:unnamed protein product [Anisakis simplex]